MDDDVNTIVMQSSEKLKRICRASEQNKERMSSFYIFNAMPRFDGIIARTMDNSCEIFQFYSFHRVVSCVPLISSTSSIHP